MKIILFFSVLFLLKSNQVRAQYYSDTTSIDLKLEDCLSISENQTTYGMIQCIDSAYIAWDAELNKNYKLLMSVLNEDEKDKLKTAQRNWLAFRDSNNEFVGLYSENLAGSMYRVSANFHSMEMVRLRALELKSYYDEIHDVRQ
jgi:uncharacterized protein YecT (DUF1311 family)